MFLTAGTINPGKIIENKIQNLAWTIRAEHFGRAIEAVPLIAPEAPYEVAGGFRNNVIFPGGLILEENGEVKIYYGAADTVQCLATTQLDDLIDFCLSFR